MQVLELDITDKELFNRYINKAQVRASELNFTNLFIWRHYYNIKYIEFDGFLNILASDSKNRPFCFFPLGDYSDKENLKRSLNMLIEYFYHNDWEFVMSRVTKEQTQLFKELCHHDIIMLQDRDNFDYVYSLQSLSTLSGKKLDGKRNHINKFKKLYSFEYEPITENNVESCREVIDKWLSHREDRYELRNEEIAINELLDNYEYLDIKGAIIKVNEQSEAFTFGEKVFNDTVIIHVEKANPDIQGLYTLINQQFLINSWQDVEYVNREQDLGIEGLRRAKLSYHPIGFVEKYTVRLC